MIKNKIYKWSLPYEVLRWYIRLAHSLFYSSVIVKGKENIPEGVPVIFAPNHQNALMDPLAIVCSIKDQVVFLARADIFSNRLSRNILFFLKILPIYRIRDGIDKMDNNKEIFDITVEVLKHNKKICLMPEGTQNDKHQLRPLVKGIFRVALQASELTCPLPVIIPVGIDYSDYAGYRSRLIIQYGQPIEILKYKEIYSANPHLALNKLRVILTEELKKLMLNIDCGEFYNTVDAFRHIYRPLALEKINKTDNSGLNSYNADKWLTDRCNDLYLNTPLKIKNIQHTVEIIQKVLRKNNISVKSISVESPNFIQIALKTIYLIVSSPLFFSGFFLNAGIIYLPHLINSKISDKQFHGSIKFVITSLVFPVYYAILLIILFNYSKSWLICLIFFAFAIFSGFFAIFYLTQIKVFFNSIKSRKYRSEIDQIKKALQSLQL